jgi:hypothetical protein
MFQRTARKWRASQQLVQKLKPILNLVSVGCLAALPGRVWAGEAIQIKAGHILTADLPVHHFEYSGRKDKVLHYYIVQFNQTIRHEDQLNLTTLGAKIVRYLPDDILVVHSGDKIARTIAGSSLSVQAVSPYLPEWKISPELSSRREASDEQACKDKDSVTLLARLFPLEDGDRASKTIHESNLFKFNGSSGRTLSFAVKCSDAAHVARLIAQSEAVEWVQISRELLDAEKKPLPLKLRDAFVIGGSAEPVQKYAWTGSAQQGPFSYDLISQQVDEFTFSKPDQLLLFVSPETKLAPAGSAKNALVLRREQLPVIEAIRAYLLTQRKIQTPSAALVKGVALHVGLELKNAPTLTGAVIVDDRSGIGAKETHEYNLHVTGPSHLCATLSYTDAPAAIASTKTLVNDLDLVLVDSSGKETELNVHETNIKKLEIPVSAGDYRVLVKGSNVPQGILGKQPYALIVSLEN